jgi:hypothetical protein
MSACCDSRGLALLESIFCQRVTYAVKLLHQSELLPLENSIHMAVYMDILKGTIEKLLAFPETAAYVCTFGAGSYAAAVV